MTIRTFFFPRVYTETLPVALGLLLLRVAFAAMLMTHGWAKFLNYEKLAAGAFPDPIGLGSAVSVTLVVFAELACAAAVVLGFLHRLALIPMIVTMAVAFFITDEATLAKGESALLYLVAFVALYITGPGRFSIDALIPRLYR